GGGFVRGAGGARAGQRRFPPTGVRGPRAAAGAGGRQALRPAGRLRPVRRLSSGPRPDRGGRSVRFYLGTHNPAWLTRVDLPLLVSHRRLARYRRLPRARAPWAPDSRGFTQHPLARPRTDTPREDGQRTNNQEEDGRAG